MHTWIVSASLFAILEWVGEHKRIRWLIYFTKPLVILALLFWIWFHNMASKNPIRGLDSPLAWFLIALICCLVGDIFLMLPENFFIAGLAAFLLGHIAYIISFHFGIIPQRMILPAIILVLMIAFVSVNIYRKLVQGLKASGKTKLILPIFIYAAVISYMLYAALTTLLDYDWHFTAALPVSFGALLFYISDILNAWHRFVAKLTAGRLKVMVTYHLAQIALAVGIIIRYFYQPDL